MYLGVMVVKHVVRSLIYEQLKTMKLYLIIYATFLLLQKQFLKKKPNRKSGECTGNERTFQWAKVIYSCRSYLKEIYLHLKVKHFKENNSVGNGSASLEYDQIL